MTQLLLACGCAASAIAGIAIAAATGTLGTVFMILMAITFIFGAALASSVIMMVI